MTITNFEDRITHDFNEDALTTNIAGEEIRNHGNLTTTGALANGIFAGVNDVTVRNFANIETSGFGAAGIYVSGENARIENYGSVHTTGDPTADESFFAEGLFAEGNAFYVANHGSVLVEGVSATPWSALATMGSPSTTAKWILSLSIHPSLPLLAMRRRPSMRG
jgi:hypothetical protein